MCRDKTAGIFIDKNNRDKEVDVHSYMESSFSARLSEGWNMCNEENE